MAFHNVPPNGFPDLPDVEELESVVKDVTSLKTSVAGLTEDVGDLNDNKANQITIAPFFNAETAYTVGDLVYYNGLTYRCTNDHEGAWDADDFAATTISNELDTLKSGLTNIGAFREFNYPEIAGASDADCVSTALADILTKMTEGSFIARILRPELWLLVCYGSVRYNVAYCNCFNTANGTLYVFTKRAGQEIQTIKTYS